MLIEILYWQQRRRDGTSGDDAEMAKGPEGSQTAATHARQQHQSQDTQQQHQSQKISGVEAPAALKEDAADTPVAEYAATENIQLRAQVQQLRTQLHHERKVSQGLLDACRQPEVHAAAKRKQNAVAEVPEWAGKCAQLGVKVQVNSKLHEGSNTVYSRTDSRITGYGFTGVGVRADVHARQQAELTAYRKKQKIFRHRIPAGYEKWFERLPMQEQLYLVSRQADREAEAAAEAAGSPQHSRSEKWNREQQQVGYGKQQLQQRKKQISLASLQQQRKQTRWHGRKQRKRKPQQTSSQCCVLSQHQEEAASPGIDQ